MAVKFKFKCTEKVEREGMDNSACWQLKFMASESEPFGQYTPWGEMSVAVTKSAADQYKVGKEYTLLSTSEEEDAQEEAFKSAFNESDSGYQEKSLSHDTEETEE